MSTWVVLLAFLVVAFLVYKFWKPMIQPPKRKVEANKARLYFFYTNWCGFSQKAMPEWEKLNKSAPSYYGTTRVEFVPVDCERDKATCSFYGVDAYPTVMLETPEGIHSFGQRVTQLNLKTFLSQTLGEERHSL